MIRILIFILSAILLAGTLTGLASIDSRISGEAFGVKFDAHSGVIIGALLVLIGLAVLITNITRDVAAIPGKIKARDAEAKRSRGIAALTRGLEAVAVGDGSAASHHARIAHRHLNDLALTRLLSAQAAQLSGDTDGARASFQAMLEAPETEFLGLRGLYHSAMTSNDAETARAHAARALTLRPNAKWAFDALLQQGLEAGAWRETREAIPGGLKNNLIGADEARRAEAALLTADAYASSDADSSDEALKEIGEALKKAPDFAPAAVFAARLHLAANARGKAIKTLEQAYSRVPHISLIASAISIAGNDDTPEKKAALFERLAGKNPQARESAMLRARAALLREEWEKAVDALEPFAADMLYAHEITVMAEAIAGHRGDDAAQPWFQRAANAPRDPRPGADGTFHLTREGWAALIKDYTFENRLSPPPLEDIRIAVPIDDVRQLLAAPAEPEASQDTDEAATNSADHDAAVKPDSNELIADEDANDTVPEDTPSSSKTGTESVR